MSIGVTVPSSKLVTHAVSPSTAMSSGRPPTPIGPPTTSPDARSIRVTVPSPPLVT